MYFTLDISYLQERVCLKSKRRLYNKMKEYHCGINAQFNAKIEEGCQAWKLNEVDWRVSNEIVHTVSLRPELPSKAELARPSPKTSCGYCWARNLGLTVHRNTWCISRLYLWTAVRDMETLMKISFGVEANINEKKDSMRNSAQVWQK